MTTDPSPPDAVSAAPVSRRALLRELGGLALVLAVPIATVVATARPIPNPVGRRERSETQQDGSQDPQLPAGADTATGTDTATDTDTDRRPRTRKRDRDDSPKRSERKNATPVTGN